MTRLFGTDGIRGIANSYPMTSEVALKVGQAVAGLFGKEGRQARVVIGQDTRLSGDMLVNALVAGVCSAGADAELVGVLPTPGIALITRTSGASAGIVVSASHNPYQDNGIKIFGSDGFKLPDVKEAQIEDVVISEKAVASNSTHGQEIGRVRFNAEALRTYLNFLKACTAMNRTHVNGFKIILDCANGATCQVAPLLFSELGASVEALHVAPDGKNINHKCGSQHPESLAQQVLSQKADVGLAFDGDGDRLIAVDDTGEVVTGDRVLAVCARHLMNQSRLRNKTVVSTVMSNVGLSRALKDMGVRHMTTQVGDRYVMEAMRASGAVLGGEDSGHMIFAEHHTTGDGILTALMLLEAIRAQSETLSQLKTIMTPFPQVLMNVPVKSKPRIDDVPRIQDAIRKVEADLGDNGRVLVRYSGTESLCRVMVEGPTEEKTRCYCRAIADAVAKELG
jgi:phosphoglucosamine mutase